MFNYRLDYTKVPINPILKCSIEIILSNHSYLQACKRQNVCSNTNWVCQLQAWALVGLFYSSQCHSIWEHSDPIMITCLFRFLCLWLCVCAVQFLKGLLVLFKDVAILFDHLQLIMEVSIKPPVSDISPGSPSHAVAFCVFNQFQGCPAETYLTLQSKWTHSETFKPFQ